MYRQLELDFREIIETKEMEYKDFFIMANRKKDEIEVRESVSKYQQMKTNQMYAVYWLDSFIETFIFYKGKDKKLKKFNGKQICGDVSGCYYFKQGFDSTKHYIDYFCYECNEEN